MCPDKAKYMNKLYFLALWPLFSHSFTQYVSHIHFLLCEIKVINMIFLLPVCEEKG